MKYPSYDILKLAGYLPLLEENLRALPDVCIPDVERFRAAYASRNDYETMSDEQKHHLCYVSSCTLVDYLKRRHIPIDWIAPYSMGLFSSLYAAGCLSLQDGFALMNHVCQTALLVGGHLKGYGMGAVVGLSRSRVERLLEACCTEVQISDELTSSLIVLSGKTSEFDPLFEMAIQDGAIQCKRLPVELPYHSPLMKDAEPILRAFVDQLSLRDPRCPIVACTDQKVLTTASDVREEAATNVLRPLNWKRTVEVLLKEGVDHFVECGFCENLSKMIKMTAGSLHVFHPKRFERLLPTISEEGSPPEIGTPISCRTGRAS